VKRKSVVFSVRMAPDDRAEIIRLASEAGISQSELIVRRVLGRGADRLETRVRELEELALEPRGFRG
jgi:hypothetical protein